MQFNFDLCSLPYWTGKCSKLNFTLNQNWIESVIYRVDVLNKLEEQFATISEKFDANEADLDNKIRKP